MGPARNPNPRPRRHGGGRSVSYSARREERGTVGQHAAEWSDAAARSVFSALHEGRLRQGLAICKFTEGILSNLANDSARFVTHDCRGMCAADRSVAIEIMSWHARPLSDATTRVERVRRVRAFRKPLRERSRVRGSVGRLEVTPATVPPMGTFHKWLAGQTEQERRRELPAGGRTQAGLNSWPREWQEEWGVVICYERAVGRLQAEGTAATPSEAMVRTLIRTDHLPTAVASAADHYVLVGPRGEARYMSVEEVSRAPFGVASSSSLTAALADPVVMSEIQAVSCLGRSVHRDAIFDAVYIQAKHEFMQALEMRRSGTAAMHDLRKVNRTSTAQKYTMPDTEFMRHYDCTAQLQKLRELQEQLLAKEKT